MQRDISTIEVIGCLFAAGKREVATLKCFGSDQFQQRIAVVGHLEFLFVR